MDEVCGEVRSCCCHPVHCCCLCCLVVLCCFVVFVAPHVIPLPTGTWQARYFFPNVQEVHWKGDAGGAR